MKNYVAIYEDVVTEPEIPDGPGNEPQPLTYPIVYQNTMDASGVDALPTTYVEGEETGLVSLDKEGFVFMGWMANGTVIEGLNATLQDGLLQEDKIYISAVWELETPSLDNLNDLNKTYDGVRLLARGAVTSAVNVSVNSASKAAVAAIEKAGGTAEIE